MSKLELVLRNYNTIEIFESFVVKSFLSKDRFKRELEFHRLFSQILQVPKIIEIKESEQSIIYERIKHESWDRESLKEFFDYLINLDFNRNSSYTFSEFFYDELLCKDSLNELIHGDFRLDNILLTKKGLYFIDFENSGYLFKEFDLAYLYYSILSRGFMDYAEDILDFVKEKLSYRRFLIAARHYCLQIIKNPRVEDKEVWFRNIASIERELNSFYN